MHILSTMRMFSPTICVFTMGTNLLSIEVLTIFFLTVLGTELLAASTLLITVFKLVDGGPVLVA